MKGMRVCAMWVALLLAVGVTAGPAWAGTTTQTQPAAAKKIMDMTLSGSVTDREAPTDLFSSAGLSLEQIVAALDRARSDADVAGIILRLNGAGMGFAQIQTVRAKVMEVRAAGKKVYCLLQDAGNGEYLLATAADRIAIVPAGGLDLVGLSADTYFFKGLLDKIGVQADLLQMGSFKGAAEPFTRTTMSNEMRQTLTTLLDDLYWAMVTDVASGRNLNAKRVQTLIDNGPYLADDAVKEGLIDWSVYPDQFDTRVRSEFKERTQVVKETFGRQTAALDGSNPMGFLSAFMALISPPAEAPPSGLPRVAIVYVTGMIVSGDADTGLFGSEQAAAEPIVQALRRARRDRTVRAVVLRVESPGGSVLASDLIWREVAECARVKPVIASMGNVAASGGYYIVTPATAIVAQPGTITGSIGVVGGKLVLGGLYEKIGIHKETITRGEHAAYSGEGAPFTDSERKLLERLMQRVYEDFARKVAEGRKMAPDKVEGVAQGRIWSGTSAKRVGLVDQLGGLEDALRLAKQKAGLKPDATVELLRLPRQKGLLERLLGGGSGMGVTAPALPEGLGAEELRRIAPYASVGQILRRERAAVVLPYLVEVK